MWGRWACALICAAAVLAACRPAGAEEIVWATGRVFAADGRTPLAGAVVAAYDDKNHVIDYATTDAQGNYALALPRGALHLSKAGGGFFHQVVGTLSGFAGGVGKVASWPLKEGIRVAAAAANAADPLTKVGVGAASSVASTLVDAMNPGEKGKRSALDEARRQPGAVVLKVATTGRNDAVNVARVFWMQEELYRGGGKEQRVLTAWIDPARMTPVGDAKPSEIQSPFLLFTDARVEPSIAQVGQEVVLRAALPRPDDPRAPVVVVARNSRTGQKYELTPAGANVYEARLTVDKRFPADDQVLSVIAYPQQGDQPGRNAKVEAAIEKSGLWNPSKPFVYNPLLVASRNRADVTLTIVRAARRR